MHLLNILNQLNADEKEKEYLTGYFKDKTITHHDVAGRLKKIRSGKKRLI